MAFINWQQADKYIESGSLLPDSFNSALDIYLNYGNKSNNFYYGLYKTLDRYDILNSDIENFTYGFNAINSYLSYQDNSNLKQPGIFLANHNIWDFQLNYNVGIVNENLTYEIPNDIYLDTNSATYIYDFPLSNEIISDDHFDPYQLLIDWNWLLPSTHVSKAVEEYGYRLFYEHCNSILENIEKGIQNYIRHFKIIISNIWKPHYRASILKFARCFMKIISSSSIDEDSALIIFTLKENVSRHVYQLIFINHGTSRIYNRKNR